MAQNTGLLPQVIIGNVSINNGEPLPGRLTITQDWIRVRFEHSTKPDPSWAFVDDAAHWHAFAEPEDDTKTAELPTLDRKRVEVPCDGSCGGVCDGTYSIARFTCRVCGQEVEPRWISDEDARDVGKLIPGLKDWELEVESYDRILRYQVNDKLSIRMDADAGTFFGIGLAADHSTQYSSSEGVHSKVTIYSAGPLGKRLA
jgi:hypothetical protein